jgi:predicted nucleic acid-binding protein
MKLVIDASVVVKWFVEEIGSTDASRLLEDERFVFVVPSHAFGEIGNTLATYVRRGQLPREQVRGIASTLLRHLESVPADTLFAAAVDIAIEIGQTVYDTLYIALAEELDTVVATADERLLRALASTRWQRRVRNFADVTG